MTSGALRPPGYTMRFCPICGVKTGTHREPVDDDRNELVVYHPHNDTIGKPCRMGGQRAAIRAVAFTNAGPNRSPE